MTVTDVWHEVGRSHISTAGEAAVALDDQESTPGVRRVAVALAFDSTRRAAFSPTIPTQRAPMNRLHELARRLMRAADYLSGRVDQFGPGQDLGSWACREHKSNGRSDGSLGTGGTSMPGTLEQRLAELGLKLPAPPPALANYVGAVRAGNLVFVSGHGPYRDGQYHYIGKVDSQVSVEEAYKSAQLTILNELASLKAEIGSLDRVHRVVKLFGMVNSDAGFGRQPEVINGASDLLVRVFGDRGKHARSAVGMGALPMGISVEIEMVVEVE